MSDKLHIGGVDGDDYLNREWRAEKARLRAEAVLLKLRESLDSYMLELINQSDPKKHTFAYRLNEIVESVVPSKKKGE